MEPMEPEFHKWSQKIRFQQSGSMNKAELAGQIRLQQSGSMNKADLAGLGGKRRCEQDAQTDRQTDRQTDKQTDRQTNF